MITKFKIFEAKANKYPPNFKVGDKVYCINDSGNDTLFIGLEYGNIYTIKKIKNENEYYFCDTEEFNLTDVACSRFLSEFEWNTIKYNI